MAKTRPLPLSPWPVVDTGRVAPRADATLPLGALDILPADDFEARLVEVDGARFGRTSVRGGRVVAAPVAILPPPPSPRPQQYGAIAPAVAIPPPAWDEADVVTSFRTGPLARLLSWLGRLLGR